MKTFILLFQCQDRKGIVAKVSDFIFRHDANIITAGQHTTDPRGGYFFMRVEFLIDNNSYDKAALITGLTPVAEEFNAEYGIYDKSQRLRMGICVSRPDHCLAEILYLYRSGQLYVDIPFVISNYEGHKELVGRYNVPFYFVPATNTDNRENRLLQLVSQDTDFLVLARYMLLLSGSFLKSYGKDIINIHHGFLPSFKGANPYCQALEKGVKVIGATAHFVTEQLDNGPIITQAVADISHQDDLKSLLKKGRGLEKQALNEAISAYLDYRVIKHSNKTIVF